MVTRGAISLGTLPVIIGLAAAIPLRDDMGSMSMTISTPVPDTQRYEEEAGNTLCAWPEVLFRAGGYTVFSPVRPFVSSRLFQQEMLAASSKVGNACSSYSNTAAAAVVRYQPGTHDGDHTSAADPHVTLLLLLLLPADDAVQKHVSTRGRPSGKTARFGWIVPVIQADFVSS